MADDLADVCECPHLAVNRELIECESLRCSSGVIEAIAFERTDNRTDKSFLATIFSNEYSGSPRLTSPDHDTRHEIRLSQVIEHGEFAESSVSIKGMRAQALIFSIAAKAAARVSKYIGSFRSCRDFSMATPVGNSAKRTTPSESAIFTFLLR